VDIIVVPTHDPNLFTKKTSIIIPIKQIGTIAMDPPELPCHLDKHKIKRVHQEWVNRRDVTFALLTWAVKEISKTSKLLLTSGFSSKTTPKQE
jgi:hypothetical protein